MPISTTATPELKTKLRKMKTVPAKVKAAVYGGCINGPGATIQFNQDVSVYGLYEALLFVEGYEKSGDYAPGTAEKALATFNK